MTLRKQIQLRKGTIALSVFKAEGGGKIMLSLDKDFVSRRVKGPLFTEDELGEIADLIREYEEWESKAYPTSKHAARNELPAYDPAIARNEIERAIQQTTNTAVQARAQPEKPLPKSPGKITVIPTMPEYRYLHTCTRCGCHVPSYLQLPGTALKLCPNCQHVNAMTT